MQPPSPWSPPAPLPLPIESDRLVVDVWRDEDAQGLFEAVDTSRAALAPWLPWPREDHHSAEESLARIRAFTKERGYAVPEDLPLGVFERGQRRVLGGTGLHRIERASRTAEIGYWMRADRQGEGLCTEAVAALTTSAFRDWGFRRLRLACDSANVASRRVAEKLGFRLEARKRASAWRSDDGWSDQWEYALLAEEWDADTGRGPGGPGDHDGDPEGAKSYAATDPRIAPYVEALLQPEDDVLAEIRARSVTEGLPPIAVGPMDGRHLEVIARASGARRMVEIGTLGGYSAVHLARALPEGGVLHTFEMDPHHAEVAGESLRRAGLAKRVRIHVGPALEKLAEIESEGPFDLVFIDADKETYPAYLDWAERNVRAGGVLLADNVFRKPRERPAGDIVHAFNERLARSGPWRATLLPIEDGLAVAVRLGPGPSPSA